MTLLNDINHLKFSTVLFCVSANSNEWSECVIHEH